MIIVIAEKPDQAARLAAPFPSTKRSGFFEIKPNSTFPNGALVTWAIGHLCELKAPEEYNPSWKRWSVATLPMIPERFEYKVTKSKWKQFSIIKQLLNRADIKEIIIGGDAGREGELIIRTIINLCRVRKPMKRLWISSLTEGAVKSGFAKLLDEKATYPLYQEALSRACADWLVGMNCSRIYTMLLKEKGLQDVFSIGRVQTPTLALIVKREKEIAQFISEPFWEVETLFQFGNQQLKGTWHLNKQTRIESEQKAKAIAQFCKEKQVRITSIVKKRKEYPPPLLFNLSTLQATANRLFKFPPQKTLDVLQKLYLKGHVSYPRSDSQYITKEEANGLPSILNDLRRFEAFQQLLPAPIQSISQNKRYVNEKKVTDHHAIIPTEQLPVMTKLSAEEANLYDLIVRQVIAAHYPNAIYDYTTIDSIVDGRATFISKGKQQIEEGWRMVVYQKNEKDNATDPLLPLVQVNDLGHVEEAKVKTGRTMPPKRYTEGNLITLMKTAGKHLDDAVLEKVLASKEGLGTEATRAGIIALLKERRYIEVTKNEVYPTEKGMLLIEALGDSILTSPSMTAKWEQRLSEIGKGTASPKAFMENVHKLTVKLTADAKEKKEQWNFDTSLVDRVSKSSPSKDYRSNIRTVIGVCKLCGGSVLDFGKSYGCSNYKKTNCPFHLSKKILGKTITKTNVKKLLETGESNLIKGFKKGERQFEAKLSWNEKENKINFLFQNNKGKLTLE